MGANRTRAAGSVALALIASVQVAIGQDSSAAPRGVELTLDLAQSLFVGDNLGNVANPSDSSAVLETDLTFGIRSETRTQTFAFTVGTTLELGYLADDGGSVSGFTDPVMRLSYRREADNAVLSFNSSYRSQDVGDTILTDEFTGEDLIVDNGKQEDLSASTSLAWGTDGPYGASVGYSFANRNYTNSTQTSLIDRETETVNLGAFVQIGGASRLSFSARETQTREDDATQTVQTQTRFGLSLRHEISDATTLTVSVNDTEIETVTTTAGVETTVIDEGYGYSFGISHDLRNGSISGSFGRTVERGGERDTLRLTRSLDLPDGSLSFSIGGTERNGQGFDPLYSLAFNKDFKSATARFNLNQSAQTDIDGNSSINTGVSARFTQELSAISSLELFGSLSEARVMSGPDPDRSTARLGIAYNRDLTEDWSLRTGYDHRNAKSDDVTTLRSNRVFLTLDRRFNLRP